VRGKNVNGSIWPRVRDKAAVYGMSPVDGDIEKGKEECDDKRLLQCPGYSGD